MTPLTDFFRPAILFSVNNPFLRSAEAGHRVVFRAFDRSARAQLRFAEDLLDLNRRRFQLLYDDRSFGETLVAHRQLVTDLGRCAGDYAGALGAAAMALLGGARGAARTAANDPRT